MQPNAPFHLRVEGGPGAGQRFPVAGSGVTIGRQPGNAIVLEDGRLSRRHAQLDLGPGGLVVTDLGSANGTRVNGQPLAAGQAHPLRPGDALDLGGVVLRVEGAAHVAATAVATPRARGHVRPSRRRDRLAPASSRCACDTRLRT